MEIGKFEIEQASATKDVRYYLNDCAHLQKLDGQDVLAACDGSILAVVPVKLEEGDTEGFIQGGAIKKGRKLGSLKANGSIVYPDGSSEPRDTKDGGKFPDIARVIPDLKTLSPVELTFDAELLYRLARAISPKSKAGIRKVTLRMDATNPESCALYIEGADGAFGVLISMRK